MSQHDHPTAPNAGLPRARLDSVAKIRLYAATIDEIGDLDHDSAGAYMKGLERGMAWGEHAVETTGEHLARASVRQIDEVSARANATLQRVTGESKLALDQLGACNRELQRSRARWRRLAVGLLATLALGLAGLWVAAR